LCATRPSGSRSGLGRPSGDELEQPTSESDAEVRAKMLNAQLLLDGYAAVSTYPPNVKYVELFTRYQAEAREAGAGLWGADD